MRVKTKHAPVQTRAQKLAQRHQSRVQDYKRVFSSEQGKRVIYDLMENHFVMKPTFRRNDTHSMAFNEGQRQVVMRILSLLKMQPQQVDQLITEATEDANNVI